MEPCLQPSAAGISEDQLTPPSKFDEYNEDGGDVCIRQSSIPRFISLFTSGRDLGGTLADTELSPWSHDAAAASPATRPAAHASEAIWLGERLRSKRAMKPQKSLTDFSLPSGNSSLSSYDIKKDGRDVLSHHHGTATTGNAAEAKRAAFSIPGAFRMEKVSDPAFLRKDSMKGPSRTYFRSSALSSSLVPVSAEFVDELDEQRRDEELAKLRQMAGRNSSLATPGVSLTETLVIEAVHMEAQRISAGSRRAKSISWGCCYLVVAMVAIVSVVMGTSAVTLSAPSPQQEPPIVVDGAGSDSPKDPDAPSPHDPLPFSDLPEQCFRTSQELRDAVDAYLLDSSDNSTVAQTRGWPIATWCVTLIQDFSELFSADRNPMAALFDEELSDWDMSNARNLESLFFNAAIFNRPLDAWDVSRVRELRKTFAGSVSFNQDLPSWDTARVHDMQATFWGAETFNGDVSTWDMSAATATLGMFHKAEAFDGDLSAWNVQNVHSMDYMFMHASRFNGDLSAWNVSKVSSMTGMFEAAHAFQSDLPWDVRNVTNFVATFKDALSFNGDISSWQTDSLKYVSFMFEDAQSFNQDVSGFDVSKVDDMSGVFRRAYAFNQDLSAWNVSRVADFANMFRAAHAFEHSLCGWGKNMLQEAEVINMFAGTACLVDADPVLNDARGPEHLCDRCRRFYDPRNQ